MHLVPKSVFVCLDEPVMVLGVQAALEQCADFVFAGAESSILAGTRTMLRVRPDIVLVEAALGREPVLVLVREARRMRRPPAVALFGARITEEQAVRFLVEGARGLIPKTATVESFLECLRTMAAGHVAIHEALLDAYPPLLRPLCRHFAT